MCLHEPPPHFQKEWKALFLYPSPPKAWRAGFISHVEGGRWLVTLNGYFGEHAPTEYAGFLEYARSLTRPDLYNYLKEATPIGPISQHKVKDCRWRHYEKLPRFPEGLVILGDAACAFNPLYGQGMSVAGLGAELLDTCLREQAERGELSGLAQRFRERLPEVIRLPWLLGTGMDLLYPQAVGKRPFGLGLLHWYILRLMERTSTDAHVHRQFYRILHLHAGLEAVLQPSVARALKRQEVAGALSGGTPFFSDNESRSTWPCRAFHVNKCADAAWRGNGGESAQRSGRTEPASHQDFP